MCFIAKSSPVRSERTVAVDWHECAWSPAITVQMPETVRAGATKPLPAWPFLGHTDRCHRTNLNDMKSILPSARRLRAGFTLVELLVVIAIIGILAAMLMPVLAAALKKAKVAKAKTEVQAIATAVEAYDSAYGRFPASSGNAPSAQNAAGTGDFTYGANIGGVNLVNGTYPTNNSEVIAILTDNTDTSVNANHQKNPKQTHFLSAKPSGDMVSPGVGTDLVYRDPWGTPYIISMDLNYDEETEDAFYSGTPGSAGGLTKQPDNNYALHGKVMVWSAGPDKKIDSTVPGNAGANKDNVLSW